MIDKDTLMLLIPVLLVAAAGSVSIFLHYKDWKREKEHTGSLFRNMYRGIYALALSMGFLIYLIYKMVSK
jgi:hypothetical protein